ncbi:hypothetical protein MMC28_009938 [Mycoblastus sanguinarius]|nr:hypothetical protein [Mycoblastus sanguinarius]
MACTPKVAEEMLSKVYQSLSARRGEAFTRMTPEAVEVEAAEAVQEAMRVAIFMQAAGEAVVVAVAEVPDLEAVGMRAADTEEDDYGSLEISSLQSIRCRTRSLSNDFTKFSAFPTRTHDMTYDGYDLDHSSEVAEDKYSCVVPQQLQRETAVSSAKSRYIATAKSFSQSDQLKKRSASEDAVGQENDKQDKAPWHREGSDVPPVARQRSAGAMTKGNRPSSYATSNSTDSTIGKLLTTPSRLLKLILPLTTLDKNSDRKDVEPLALLVHPQQPLSYLERLIQSELPPIRDNKGEDKIPAVRFKAEDSQQDEIEPRVKKPDETPEDLHDDAKEGDLEETKFDGQLEKTGKLGKMSIEKSTDLGEGGVERYSSLGHEGPSADGAPRKFVRWSSSTEIGDFIRDAARGKEFSVEIEDAPKEIRVAVPSFNDRTHYLRLRLRKTASQIIDLAKLKKDCDLKAHSRAQHVAMGGAGLLVAYWYTVYRLTFETDLGWDVMEPYLVGLSTLICGYLWFLWHNREVSYRSALNLTISRRQTQLYQQKGFDIHKWESLIEEANGYRKEIKQIAGEYDVEWDEHADEKDERVTEAMRKSRDDRNARRKEKDDKDDDDN